MKTQYPSDQKSLRDAFKMPQNQTELQQFLSTPEGQVLKAQYSIRMAEEMMQTTVEKMQKLEKHDLASQMLFHLALQELTEVLQKNQKFLQTNH
jgi:hypothetical protein